MSDISKLILRWLFTSWLIVIRQRISTLCVASIQTDKRLLTFSDSCHKSTDLLLRRQQPFLMKGIVYFMTCLNWCDISHTLRPIVSTICSIWFKSGLWLGQGRWTEFHWNKASSSTMLISNFGELCTTFDTVSVREQMSSKWYVRTITSSDKSISKSSCLKVPVWPPLSFYDCILCNGFPSDQLSLCSIFSSWW